MEESTCYEVAIYLSQRFSNVVLFHRFISFKYDFHVDAERMIVKTREM